jgi:hypothetical protein
MNEYWRNTLTQQERNSLMVSAIAHVESYLGKTKDEDRVKLAISVATALSAHQVPPLEFAQAWSESSLRVNGSLTELDVYIKQLCRVLTGIEGIDWGANK